ncbi:MAG: ComEA family DNA-binding protein [Desulfonatronovibrionaceae bacterium]
MKKSFLFRTVVFCMALVFVLGTAGIGLGADKININTASESKLQDLQGIGEVKAERIVDYRQDHRFQSKDEIMEVKGIGPGTYAQIKDDITAK